MKTATWKHDVRSTQHQAQFEISPLDPWETRVKVVATLNGRSKSRSCYNHSHLVQSTRHDLAKELAHRICNTESHK